MSGISDYNSVCAQRSSVIFCSETFTPFLSSNHLLFFVALTKAAETIFFAQNEI